MEMQKSYYAIIPANVRYDRELTPNAKLLYGEITALCNEKGYCWANNEYFSELYGVSKTSISKWISQLVKKEYIFSEIVYKEGTKEILHRYLKLVKDPIEEKLKTPIKEKLKDNNTKSNNTINKHIYGEFKHVRLSDTDIEKLKELTLDVEGWIKRLDEYIEQTGKSYKNHYLTIRNWIAKEPKSKPQGQELPSWYGNIPKEKASSESLAKALEMQRKLKQKDSGLPDWWNEEYKSTPPSQELLDSIAEKERKLKEGK